MYWPKDELGVIFSSAIGALVWKGVIGEGTMLLIKGAAEEGVLYELPCSQ